MKNTVSFVFTNHVAVVVRKNTLGIWWLCLLHINIYRTDLHFLCIFADTWFDEIESIRDDINLGFDPDDYYDKNYDPWVAFNDYLVKLRDGEQIMKDVNNAIRCYELRNSVKV